MKKQSIITTVYSILNTITKGAFREELLESLEKEIRQEKISPEQQAHISKNLAKVLKQ